MKIISWYFGPLQPYFLSRWPFWPFGWSQDDWLDWCSSLDLVLQLFCCSVCFFSLWEQQRDQLYSVKEKKIQELPGDSRFQFWLHSPVWSVTSVTDRLIEINCQKKNVEYDFQFWFKAQFVVEIQCVAPLATRRQCFLSVLNHFNWMGEKIFKPLFSSNQKHFELCFKLCLCCQITKSSLPCP